MTHRRRAVPYAALATLFSMSLSAQESVSPVAPKAPERPRLVVMVAVDQLIPEQLERLAPLLDGGLGRFVRGGSMFPRARLQYGDTETGPGHATYGTGMNPLHHGLVGNDWVLPEQKAPSYCVSDPDSKSVTSEGPTSRDGRSPHNIRAIGLCDRLKALDPESKAFAVSSKDRSAIGMSGQHPDVVLWWDRTHGGFVSSTWYVETLPPWVIEFNGQWLSAFTRDWGRGWSALDSVSLEGTDTARDDAPGEVAWRGRSVFPYPAPDLPERPDAAAMAEIAAVVYGSPAGDRFVCDLARRAVGEMQLGSDEHTDVLYVSLSSCDTVGHAFGPRSREVTDVLLRADRELELLFQDLDRQVGVGRWIASLTADHGVMDLPEALVQRGIGAERVEASALSASVKAMRKRVEQEFGDDFFLFYDSRGVRLSWKRIEAAGKSLKQVREFAARALELESAAWLERAWTWDELEGVARQGEPAQGWRRSWANSFDEQRTPDVVIQSKPWKLLAMGSGTTHGTPYEYDTRIPLAFYGPGFPARASFEPASSVDAVPTLLAALGMPLDPNFDGRALSVR